MKERILSHMNEEHRDILPLYVKYFNKKEIKEAKLIDINEEEMFILAENNEKIVVKLTARTELKDMHMELVKMAKIVREGLGIAVPEHHKEENHKQEEKLKIEIKDFIADFKSVILGTLTAENFPTVSFAPYFKYEGNSYIFISEAGEHFHNLKVNGKLELMFIEDESKTKVIALRKRVKYKAIVKFLDRDELTEKILDAFQESEPSIKMTRTMPDFHLIKLNLLDGRYVKGAGQAFHLKEDGRIIPIGGKGHGHKIVSVLTENKK